MYVKIADIIPAIVYNINALFADENNFSSSPKRSTYKNINDINIKNETTTNIANIIISYIEIPHSIIFYYHVHEALKKFRLFQNSNQFLPVVRTQYFSHSYLYPSHCLLLPQ